MDQEHGVQEFAVVNNKKQAYIEYFDRAEALLSVIRKTQGEAIQQAARMIAQSMAKENNILHIFGTGHSHMLAEELFYRAGGFANVNAILETGLMLHEGAAKSTALERLHDYAPKVWLVAKQG